MFSSEQIQELICTGGYHPDPVTGKHFLTHYQVGERRCRKCMQFFKVEYKGLQCPKCKQNLAYSPHRKKAHKDPVIKKITETKYKVGKYYIFNDLDKGLQCDCMGFLFRQNCWHIRAIRQKYEINIPG